MLPKLLTRLKNPQGDAMKLTTLIAAAALTLTAATARADESRYGIDDSPSATAMAADLLLIRPIGLVATVIGAGLFVLQLPLSLIIGQPPSEAAKKLVSEPARYTFRRRLGQMD
jgi:hypothetical protein